MNTHLDTQKHDTPPGSVGWGGMHPPRGGSVRLLLEGFRQAHFPARLPGHGPHLPPKGCHLIQFRKDRVILHIRGKQKQTLCPCSPRFDLLSGWVGWGGGVSHLFILPAKNQLLLSFLGLHLFQLVLQKKTNIMTSTVRES